MNRHERRRGAAKRKPNKLVDEYVHHLPEVGPEVAFGEPGVFHMIYYHDDWCGIYAGKACDCDPDIRYFAEPERS